MKAKEVLKTLRVTRNTLHTYVKQGKIRTVKYPNGRYEYNQEDVWKIAGIERNHLNIIYARVSTRKQKNDLLRQIDTIESYCLAKGYTIDKTFRDIASGINFEKRKQFFELLDLVLDYQVARVFVSYKDRLNRVGFSLFKHLFERHGCEIVVMNGGGSEKLDNDEIFEEIISLIHCFSMKHYSQRRVKKLKKTLSIEEDKEKQE